VSRDFSLLPPCQQLSRHPYLDRIVNEIHESLIHKATYYSSTKPRLDHNGDNFFQGSQIFATLLQKEKEKKKKKRRNTSMLVGDLLT
jgi:hypothetical protein